jgi:DNA topoisomerase VI subunit A
MHNNGRLEKLLSPPKPLSAPEKVNQEIAAYSFDRAVICDRDEVAHCLIANNFHFENNCAVLSINGYPQSIFTTVLEMLHRNPNLKVYALHDASPAGVQLVHRLRTTPRWFAERHGVTIYDLGLLPRQVMKRNMFVLQELDAAQQAKRLPEAVRNTLQPDELKWLAEGKFVELESLAPMTLLKLLRDGIAKSRMPESDDALVVVGDSGYYGGGDGVSVYSVDSFG